MSGRQPNIASSDDLVIWDNPDVNRFFGSWTPNTFWSVVPATSDRHGLAMAAERQQSDFFQTFSPSTLPFWNATAMH